MQLHASFTMAHLVFAKVTQFMVVMEYLDGMTAKRANQLHQLLPKFFADVQEILNQLHENDFVFGG